MATRRKNQFNGPEDETTEPTNGAATTAVAESPAEARPRKPREKLPYRIQTDTTDDAHWIDVDTPELADRKAALTWAQANIPGGTQFRVFVDHGSYKVSEEVVKKTVIARC